VLLKTAKRLIIFVIGGTVVLIGVVLLVAPGPATVVIPIGLAILATEFVWARRLLKRFRDTAGDIVRYYWPPQQPPADSSKEESSESDEEQRRQ